ncbi:N-acetylmuramoyl-L-alanine amidase [Crassaminicella profunda]|uniref:N-acetylmuramoyl-L-alanine amidase n=1 Tax=Crassaminicella profunda TaxID=1286698 RepID=UPI001CA6511A|nr:N-acetylmuramoyl-L-alanine amidase [Crassaminicella profunda]QZY56727.1 N-acetylmuramoyl-L-alanine amidase [Crassaminicella profunda]
MRKYKFVIDPGHGGKDRANKGHSGRYVEADGNLQFALYLRDYLNPYFHVVLTRDKDKTLSLTERGRMAKGADMFLSVHSDAYTSNSSGVTIFDSVDLKNEDIAKNIGKAVADAMGIPFRGSREKESSRHPGEDYYTVIDVAQDGGCPCVLLLERGFHSNPAEEKKLLNANIVQASAEATANAIKKYYKIQEVMSMGRIFKDIEDDRWSAPYIEAAKELDIINGNDDGTFNPAGSLTREQAAVLTVRLYEKITGRKVVK